MHFQTNHGLVFGEDLAGNGRAFSNFGHGESGDYSICPERVSRSGLATGRCYPPPLFSLRVSKQRACASSRAQEYQNKGVTLVGGRKFGATLGSRMRCTRDRSTAMFTMSINMLCAIRCPAL